jgi:hypothetical protein
VSDIIHPMMEAQALRLEKRGEGRSSEFTHASNILFPCTRKLYYDRLHGGSVETDLESASRMYAGEVLESPNIEDFLTDSEGELALAKLRNRWLIDNHREDTRNPTAWRDPELELGGRFDAATIDRSGVIRLLESKTISKEFAKAIDLIYTAGQPDIFDWFWTNTAFWWTKMFCGQAAAYVHGINLKYAKEIESGEIQRVHEVDFILKPERGFAYYVRADLEQYEDLTEHVKMVAAAIRDALRSGDPSALWCKRSSRWCGTLDNPRCPHFNLCNGEREESSATRVESDPAIIKAVQAFAEVDGNDKEYKTRRDTLRDLVLMSQERPAEGEKATVRIQFEGTGYEATLSMGYTQPKRVPVTEADIERGWTSEDADKIPVTQEDLERGYVEVGEVKPSARFTPQKVKEAPDEKTN